MPTPYRPPFAEILRATFASRPNRFVVLCQLDSGEIVRAFLPNPGRLQELLLPGVDVFIVSAEASPERKTAYTMVGVAGERYPIFLHTHVNNDVARHLLEHDLVPGLEGSRIVRAEVPLGHSRFDFLLERDGAPIYLEVKSCTLFGNRVAMFPDAVTARGRRHLEELAALSQSGTRAVVLFIVHSGQVDWFMPDYHTDPEFSRTLLAVKDAVEIIPLAVSWGNNFKLSHRVRRLPIPWDHVAREQGERGNYLLLCREAGDWHLFVGWSPTQLFAQLRRMTKTLAARPDRGSETPIEFVEHFALVSSADRQRAIVGALRRAYPRPDREPVNAVGAILAITSPSDPRADRAFHRILACFRMTQPVIPGSGRNRVEKDL